MICPKSKKEGFGRTCGDWPADNKFRLCFGEIDGTSFSGKVVYSNYDGFMMMESLTA